MNEKIDNSHPDYPYKKENIDIGKSNKGYPIIERTTNGLLYPEGPKNNIDMNDIKDYD